MTGAVHFAALLTEALKEIKRRERKSLAIIQDELGYALGRSHGGSVVEYWRKGHLPTNLVELEALCCELQRRAQCSKPWLEQLLTAAHHPYPASFLEALFPCMPPTVERRLRPPLADFIGRDMQRHMIAAHLKEGTKDPSIIVIRGMGGVGKTELAHAVASDVADSYPDGVVFVPLHSTNGVERSASDVLRLVIQQVAPDQRLPDTEELAALQAHYHALVFHKRLLIVVDDVDRLELLMPLLPPRGSAMLVTTRRRMSVPGMQAIDLETLPPNAAANLVATICPRAADHATMLAERCGYLPLALRISASFLANDDTYPIPLYLEQLAHERLRLEMLRDPDNPNLDVAASLALSVNRLAPDVQAALRCLGVFSVGFREAAAGAVMDIQDSMQLRHVIGQLRRHHVLGYEPRTHRYLLHDLVRELVWQQMPDQNAVWKRYVEHMIEQFRLIVAQYAQGGDAIMAAMAQFDQEFSHIRPIWTWLMNQPPTPETDRLIILFVRATARQGALRFGLRSERIPLLEQAVAAANRQHQFEDESICLANLGITIYRAGDIPAASKCLKQALSIAEKLQNLALCLNIKHMSAVVLQAQADFTTAKQNLYDVINHEATPATLKYSCQAMLGVMLWRQGYQHDALKMVTETQVLLRAMNDHFLGSGNANTLACLYIELGELEKARMLLDEALVDNQALQQYEFEAVVLRTLAELALAQHDLDQALDLIAQAMAVVDVDCKEVYDSLRAMRAIILYERGDIAASLVEYAIIEQSTPPIADRWILASTGWKLGQRLVRDGYLAEGLSCMQHWIDYQRQIEHAALAQDAARFQQLMAGHCDPAAISVEIG